MTAFRVAVFASGSGSNFQAIVDAAKRGDIDAEIALLVCDKPQAKVVERARRAGVEVYAFRPQDYASREAYERDILRELDKRNIDLVVLAGYMRLVSDTLLKPYYGKIINIHPALLPSFPGMHGVRDAFQYGVKITGVTVHFVDSGVDTGPIIAQRAVEIREDDTEETLEERIHAAEHALYPQVIQWFREGRVKLEGRKVRVEPAGER
jgi:phosphoribosylglycinamide formyltransferase-1